MRMTWSHLLFAHWPVPAPRLRPLLPEGLEVDRYDGSAWIGIVPFRMSGVRLRLLPPVPTASRFPELNVRTYVRAGDRRGVWFFSLDAGSRLVVHAARAWYGLPYHRARMEVEERDEAVRYRSRRTGSSRPAAVFEGRYRPTGPAFRAGRESVARFLTRRLRLFARDRRGRLRAARVRHAPWPLRPAEARIRRNTMLDPLGLELPDTDPVLHYVDRLEVRAWTPGRPLSEPRPG